MHELKSVVYMYMYMYVLCRSNYEIMQAKSVANHNFKCGEGPKHHTTRRTSTLRKTRGTAYILLCLVMSKGWLNIALLPVVVMLTWMAHHYHCCLWVQHW